MTAVKTRTRRSREEAHRLILQAAEDLLRKSGPEGVSVRAVAAAIGMTDAAVNHHFGTRERLLEALLHEAGNRLKLEIATALGELEAPGVPIERLVEAIADLFADGRYGELAVRLHQAGWRDIGQGLLNPVVACLERRRALNPSNAGSVALDPHLIIALLLQTLALDPLFGDEFRRSTGLSPAQQPTREDLKRFWSAAFGILLGQN